jgi:hypothetical protein
LLQSQGQHTTYWPATDNDNIVQTRFMHDQP